MREILSEHFLREVVGVLVRFVEATGALIIFLGALIAVVRFVWRFVKHGRAATFTDVRLDLGRFLLLGLEFLLAADILGTAVAPSFEDIGKLAAVAAIRTVLNYVLRKEIAEEKEELNKG